MISIDIIFIYKLIRPKNNLNLCFNDLFDEYIRIEFYYFL